MPIYDTVMLQCMGNTMWVVEKQQQDKSSLEVRLHDGKITQRRHHNKSNGTLRCVTHTHSATSQTASPSISSSSFSSAYWHPHNVSSSSTVNFLRTLTPPERGFEG